MEAHFQKRRCVPAQIVYCSERRKVVWHFHVLGYESFRPLGLEDRARLMGGDSLPEAGLAQRTILCTCSEPPW